MSTQTHWCNLLKTPEIKSKESNQNESKSTIQLHIEHIRGLNICIVLLIWHCSHARFKYSCSSRKVYGGEDNLSIFISFSVCLSLHRSLSLSDQQDCMNNTWTVNHFSTLYPSCHLLCLCDTSIFTHIHFFSPFGPFPHLSSAICPLNLITHTQTYPAWGPSWTR